MHFILFRSGGFVPTVITLFHRRTAHIHICLAPFMIYMQSIQQSQQFGKSSRMALFTRSSMFCSNTSSLKLFNVSAHSMLAHISNKDV